MRISKKLGVALAAVGVLALSACGSSTAKLLDSSSTKTKNAALDDNSGLNMKPFTFKRESLVNYQKYPNGIGLEDQIVRDESKYTPCAPGLTSTPNIDTAPLNNLISKCQREYIIVHYTGFITAPGNTGETVSVKFRVAKDDTFFMKIGETTVIDAWHNTGCTWVEGKMDMVAGQKYPLDAWFSQYGGGICNQMVWTVGSAKEVVVPQSALSRVNENAATTTTVAATTTVPATSTTEATGNKQVVVTTTTVAAATTTAAPATTVADQQASGNAVDATTTTVAAGSKSTATTVAGDEAVANEATDTTVAASDESVAPDTTMATDSESTDNTGSGDSDGSSNVWWLWILIVIVLGGGGYAYSRKNKKN